MAIWIGLPSFVIPDSRSAELSTNPDPGYLRIYTAFGHPMPLPPRDPLLLPRAEAGREELAAAAILPLIGTSEQAHDKGFLVDCYSSAAVDSPAPTYKLALMTQLSNTPPFSIDGQSGAEVVSALLLLSAMAEDQGITCMLSAVQRVVAPDTRVVQVGFPLGDGAAATWVTTSPHDSRLSFRVLSVAVAHDEQNWFGALDSCLDEALERGGRRKASIKWGIAHQLSNAFIDTAVRILPNVRWVSRPTFADVNFGCADCLISLGMIRSRNPKELQGVGILCFSGAHGSVGVVVLCPDDTR